MRVRIDFKKRGGGASGVAGWFKKLSPGASAGVALVYCIFFNKQVELI